MMEGLVAVKNILLATLLSGATLLSAGEPAPPSPGPNQYVYEGRSAAEWATDLKAGKNVEKASHALVKLGRDAVPSLMQLIKQNDPELTRLASEVLSRMKKEKEAVPIFIELLKDPNFEVRRTAVRALGEFADTSLLAMKALEEMLKDRDRAVAEAAEEALAPFEARKRERQDIFDRATALIEAGDYREAAELVEELRRRDPGSEQAASIMRMLDERQREEAGGRQSVADRTRDEAIRAMKERDRTERMALVETLLKNARKTADVDPFKAMDLCRKVIAMDPENPEVKRMIKDLERRIAEAEAQNVQEKKGADF
jgi:tetratricopeptide (TPR) repeat protein